jgi:hypothetical protein
MHVAQKNFLAVQIMVKKDQESKVHQEVREKRGEVWDAVS